MLMRSESADACVIESDLPNYGRTFPMYVPAIDWYFLCDDSREYPMSFYLDLDFTGTIDQEKFSLALREALSRHPLLMCVIQPGKQDLPCWTLAQDPMPTIDWADEGVPFGYGDAPNESSSESEVGLDGDFIDIRRTPGLRIWVRESSDSVRMTLQFHHSACDGTGAYRFVGDLLACYMQQLPSCNNKVELGDFDPALLKVRAAKMRSIRSIDSELKKLSVALKEAWHHVGTRVSPLKAPDSKPQTKTLPGIVKRVFSADELSSMRHQATDQGATLNDWYLCKLFQAARDWNGRYRHNGKLRLLVPADMRDGNDFAIPACNMTACTFITRRASELNDDKKLLDSIRADTLQIKQGHPQRAFVNAITSAMQGSMLPWIMNKNKCMATAVLSNAGDPSRRFTCKLPKRRGKVSCDEFTLESITGVPPLRRHTRSTLSVSSYGRQLVASMRCDPYLFSQGDSQRLLDLFCDRLLPANES
ncbi:hypothetical protein [Planctomycetes bacterium K23_9]|uniref:Acyltransferase PapA5 n=1 Tax=Stieleria marina TaxID=1930275 RepID=A0A517NYQ8_9BACT|nr:hypothetical protein K239x_42550 [Planctomycetes bacterium K23_9]